MNITITPEFAAALIGVLVTSMGTAILSSWRATRAVRKLGIQTPRTADVTVLAKRLDVVSARLDTTEARLIKAYESIDLLEDENTLLRKQQAETQAQLNALLIENAAQKRELSGLHGENDAQRLRMATLEEQITQRDNTILMLRGRVGELEDQVRALQAPAATGETK